MVGRGKSEHGGSRSVPEDRISQLTDPLICEILSHLPIKDAVKTSVLSTRWRSLWLWVPRLDLVSQEFRDFNDFASFGNRFFDSNMVSCIQKLELIIMSIRIDDDASFLKSWIDAAIKRKIQYLRCRCNLKMSFYEMPISLYSCETLVSLKLDLLALAYPPEFVSLPCLKILHLTAIQYANEASFERLVSSCYVLEELEIQGLTISHIKVFRVLSTSLKRLTTRFGFNLHTSDSGIVIDAPRLCFLKIHDCIAESFIISNMDYSTVKLDIHFNMLGFNKASLSSMRYTFLTFLPGILKVKDLFMCRHIFKLLSKLEPLPQFVYLSNLQVALDYSHSIWLPTFLESFPKLKSLILVFSNEEQIFSMCFRPLSVFPQEMNQISFSSVPECLLSSLEFVDFKEQISGLAAVTNLVRYFLENSAILKKLTLPLNYHATQHNFVKKLLKIPRRSTECEVVFL